MKPRIRRPIGLSGRRRGVTLVEMLVVVALVVLMMTILVQIFQQATGAMSVSRTTQELDVNLRQLDSIIRSDLAGVTAKMTPPNDPKDKRGYFEYIENSYADSEGEDTDDVLAFTTKAAEGEVFTGRQWLGSNGSNINQGIQPATITSQVAEVIYFLRNGNLYRRVLLVVPDRAATITLGSGGSGYSTALFGNSQFVGWQGMNDISCRPQNDNSKPLRTPIPNDLGTLTNRENRAFRPRFANDLTSLTTDASGNSPPDGIPDDNNGDGVPDYYPTLYFDGVGNPYTVDGNPVWSPNGRTNEQVGYTRGARANQSPALAGYNLYAFPFIYPGMYSVPDSKRTPSGTAGSTSGIASGFGWIHATVPSGATSNHSPLVTGDFLSAPIAQTWWGFPTWRETMAGTSSGDGAGWTDPVRYVGYLGTNPGNLQSNGLQPLPGNVLPTAAAVASNLLPPIYSPGTATPPNGFYDGTGSASFVAIPSTKATVPANPNPLWEDDLLQTNVRSFDIKAYDPNASYYNRVNTSTTPPTGEFFAAGYQDLGYGSATFSNTSATANDTSLIPPYNYIGGPNGIANAPGNAAPTTPQPAAVPWQAIGGEPIGFGHEGRMPPLTADFRLHPRRFYNVGDDQPGVQRLTRVWDSWSTDYTNAPDSDLFLHPADSSDFAIYPSFPPPYPSALRGIQIQIRLADPRNERVKSITIRHDFTDKL